MLANNAVEEGFEDQLKGGKPPRSVARRPDDQDSLSINRLCFFV